MSDRACVRGCTVPDVHYATCEDFGKTGAEATHCKTGGCAPAEARKGVLICDSCYGRVRGLLMNAPDLVGRMRSLADPTKAAVYDRIRVSSSSEIASAPVPADLLDASRDVQATLAWWAGYFGEPTGRAKTDPVGAFEDAHRATLAVLADLDRLANNHATLARLSEWVLDRHEPVDGEREFWSIADAMAKFGPERRERKKREPYTDDLDRELYAEPIPEWGDPLLSRDDAETLAGSTRTLQRWVKAGEIKPAGSIYIAGILTVLYRRSEILATQERMSTRKRSGLAQYTTEEEER